jgi:hypothetical protein
MNQEQGKSFGGVAAFTLWRDEICEINSRIPKAKKGSQCEDGD